MNLLSFIAVLIYVYAATGATFKAPVYSVRKDAKWLRYKSPGTMKGVNAKTPYLSPRTQQPLRLDTGRSPQDTWCHIYKSARHGSGYAYLWVCMCSRKVSKLLTKIKGLPRIRTNCHHRSWHSSPALSHASQHLRRRALAPVPALQRYLVLVLPSVQFITFIHPRRQWD